MATDSTLCMVQSGVKFDRLAAIIWFKGSAFKVRLLASAAGSAATEAEKKLRTPSVIPALTFKTKARAPAYASQSSKHGIEIATI